MGDDEAVRRGVERLALAWFWWFVVGAVWFPFGVVFGAWVLLNLGRLAIVTSGGVARRLWLAFAVGVVAVGMSVVGRSEASTLGIWAVVAVGMALYSLAMGDWCDERGCDDGLRRSWRRSVDWAVLSAAVAVAATAVDAGWSDLLITAALAIAIPGALIAVGVSTLRLKDGLGRQEASWLA